MSFERIENYYNNFNEWDRLETPEGVLEFQFTVQEITKHIKPGMRILDLGGGPGRYTIELAKRGYLMSLADLSSNLIAQAKEKCKDIPNIESIDVVNAVDLNRYNTSSFDAVLYLGPLYHLIKDNDVHRSLCEVHRILKSDGVLIAAFIPLLSGIAGIIERSIYSPFQVDAETLQKTSSDGIFLNRSDKGFQDGKYYTSEDIEGLMHRSGFRKISMRSIRGIGYKLEKGIIEKMSSNPKLYQEIISTINSTAEDNSIVNTCGHALFIGGKFV